MSNRINQISKLITELTEWLNQGKIFKEDYKKLKKEFLLNSSLTVEEFREAINKLIEIKILLDKKVIDKKEFNEIKSAEIPALSENSNKLLSLNSFPGIKFLVDLGIKVKTTSPLEVALISLQIISAATTIEGAKIMFPNIALIWKIPGHIILGGSLQFLLVLLLIFRVAEKDPLKRWTAILVLSFVSIYSSFFSIYNQILGGELSENSPKKVQTYQDVKSAFYAPLNTKLSILKAEENRLRNDLMREETGNRGNFSGRGPIWREINQEFESIQKQISQIQPIVNNSTVKSTFELTDEEILQISPKELFFKVNSTWPYAESSVPFLPNQKLNIQKPSFSDFVDSEAFLTPFNDIRFGDKKQTATVALSIAVLVDGLSLLLGTVGQTNSLFIFKIFAAIFTVIITGFKRFFRTLGHTLEQEAIPFDVEPNGLKESIITIVLLENDSSKEAIKGSDFLLNFYRAIDWRTKFISLKQLFVEETNETYKVGYRILLDAMQSKEVKWIETEEVKFKKTGNKEKVATRWRVKSANYDALVRWLIKELRYQSNQEKTQAEGQVEIRIYSPYNSKENS